MFDYSFGKTILRVAKDKKHDIDFSNNAVDIITLLNWEEHCVECSIPYCYSTCHIYEQRKDKACVRLTNAISKDYNYHGSNAFGLNCNFKKWAKIETTFYPIATSLPKYRCITLIDNCLTKTFEKISLFLMPVSPKMKLLRGYRRLKNSLLSYPRFHSKNYLPDTFYIKCHLTNKKNAQILIQIDNKLGILYSQIHTITIGPNEIRIDIGDILKKISNLKQRIFIATLEDTLTNIVFEWVDFVKFKERDLVKSPMPKIKCVAWDLDNTLWNGILTEDGIENIKLNKSAIDVIKKLDQRGILNTIVSKNNFDDAMMALKRFKIDEHFVYPAINWGQKSENIKAIAKKINIGVDTFGFIDDNIREREEVRINLSDVRVYSDNEILKILNYPEFDVEVSKDSKLRRQSYIIESSREQYLSQFNSNYNEYLKALEMIVKVEKLNASNFDRSFELLARSNQLNLSTNRYSKDEFEKIASDKSILAYAFRCQDKFGDYGQIGFISLKIQNHKASVVDLVISCRVAKKKVENTMVIALKDILIRNNINELEAILIKTKKNGPLSDVFQDLPFAKVDDNQQSAKFIIENIGNLIDENIHKIEYV